ncbi:MAG TPA: OmpH family outer membrane protein [Sphingomicrobium sp.]|nr:OmpH family outer membrane protein [Sphingomicrobium sp.]
MKTLLISAAFGAAILAPSAASAQSIPPAIVAVVDLSRVEAECNACKTAAAALKGQVSSFETRRQTLASSLQTEQKSIQTSIDALKGKEPDAALQARVKAFQAKAQTSEQELAGQQAQIERNQQYIQKQIQDKLSPIYTQVMQRRGANLLVEVGATLATAQSVDVTGDVLASLNSSLPSLITTAPAQAAPQGR